MSSHWHLAIEASSFGGSVALLKTENANQEPLILQEILPHGGGSVRSLAPMIARLLQTAGVLPNQLSLISVTSGPGSFTGLRVGLTTAKMLAWAHKIPVAPVDTLEAIALRFAQSGLVPAGTVQLVAAINAFRKQVFTSSWIMSADSRSLERPVQPSHVCDAALWLSHPALRPDGLLQSEPEVWVTGSALEAYSKFQSPNINIAPAELWQPMAQQVGFLGARLQQAGRCVTAEQLLPNYIRASAAEEKSLGRG